MSFSVMSCTEPSSALRQISMGDCDWPKGQQSAEAHENEFLFLEDDLALDSFDSCSARSAFSDSISTTFFLRVFSSRFILSKEAILFWSAESWSSTCLFWSSCFSCSCCCSTDWQLPILWREWWWEREELVCFELMCESK